MALGGAKGERGELRMEKGCVGIGVLLFAILFQISTKSLEAISLSLGVLGLVLLIVLAVRGGRSEKVALGFGLLLLGILFQLSTDDPGALSIGAGAVGLLYLAFLASKKRD